MNIRPMKTMTPWVLAMAGLISACGSLPSKAPIVKAGIQCDFNPVVANQKMHIEPGENGLTTIPGGAVNMTQSNVSNKILVQEAQLYTTATGTTGLLARFANCTDFPLQIEARTQFLGVNGMPVEPSSGWKRLILQPRSHAQYQEYSVTQAGAGDYLLDVREAY